MSCTHQTDSGRFPLTVSEACSGRLSGHCVCWNGLESCTQTWRAETTLVTQRTGKRDELMVFDIEMKDSVHRQTGGK